nr:ribonucleotide reductase subunit alpha [Halomonas socia]
MAISNFADLLSEARKQPEPQRLLFVCARAELPDYPSEEQRRRFEQGEGGALTPVTCVDKTPDELSDMATFVEQSNQTGQDWDLVFAAAMTDPGDNEVIEQQLRRMVETLQMGSIEAFLAFNRSGEVVGFQ